MDTFIFIGLIALGALVFGGFVWLARKFNITKSEAKFANMIVNLTIYLFKEANLDIKNKDLIEKTLDIVIKSVDMFLESFDAENIKEERDIIFAYARDIAIANGIEVDDEFAKLLVNTIDYYLDEIYVPKE